MVNTGQRASTGSAPRTLATVERWVDWDLRRIAAAGLTATLLIAIGSYGAGSLPANDPTRHIPVIGLLRHGWLGLHASLSAYYLGLALLTATWLILGRVLLTGSAHGTLPVTEDHLLHADAGTAGGLPAAADGSVIDPRRLRTVLIRWMLPLLVAMPLASQDLYSYAAQARLAEAGYDPYKFTPADLPGKFLDNVAWKWLDTPSPYGPLWVTVSRWTATITGDHALITAMVLRLIPFAAILGMAWLIPGMARHLGHRGDLALWLAIANPLVLVHGVGGGHNDAVMVFLLVAGLAVVLREGAGWRALAGAAALMALSAAVKAPGAIGVAFVVPVFMAGRAELRVRDWLRACLIAAAVAVPVFSLITWMVGYGNGWIKQVSPTIPVISLMSIPTVLGVLYNLATGQPHAGTLVDHTVRAFRRVGTVVNALVLTYLWFRAVRGSALQLFALALVSVVLLSPAVQPWYFTWALAPAALFLSQPRGIFWVAFVSVALTFLVQPMGSGVGLTAYVPTVLVGAFAARSLLGPVVQRVRT
ncbi:polyprenol phosphomannose-dependent alpha 1,6 mannosyltransferase MptB [Jatrophihabitans telluris]|uniref:Polyprenol phosphomannose-dependent alpha 1,6 mannosyltransferase MptB n=1 Tax=Jatrophihabitans telluris TaxID=2038343 RepID=A0ABY4QVQ6_9ACTN|nr:polyprenol phosphomannose-dependent alpha 1,6 mannosyltransferase MptB [Jatrophihabitans telluris]UQX87217.1 polyprenol phosphomannose-dependent alpha 1,6 mannosyltransferase MptB [Jatrophihabitans telluris]